MSKIIYLVQGQAKFVKKYFDFQKRRDISSILLTYDQQIDGALYYPDSTWGEGRNYLLKKALETGESYQYYIFLDDDVKFLQGDYTVFEKQLLRYKPAIATPVFAPKTDATIMGYNNWFNKKFVPLRNYQLCRFADAQFIAFHKDVVADNLVVPLQTHFDKVSWYATSSTQQLLMFNLYQKYILQFNNIKVQNANHGVYAKHEFKEDQRSWLTQQFRKTIYDPRPYAKVSKSFFSFLVLKDIIIKTYVERTLSFIGYYFYTIAATLLYKPREHYRINPKDLIKELHKDSTLLNQYFDKKHHTKKEIHL